MRRREGPQVSWVDEVTFDRVLVFTVDDDTIEGVITDVFVDGLQMEDARLLRAHENPVPFAGTIFISKSKIKFVQRPGGGHDG